MQYSLRSTRELMYRTRAPRPLRLFDLECHRTDLCAVCSGQNYMHILYVSGIQLPPCAAYRTVNCVRFTLSLERKLGQPTAQGCTKVFTPSSTSWVGTCIYDTRFARRSPTPLSIPPSFYPLLAEVRPTHWTGHYTTRWILN